MPPSVFSSPVNYARILLTGFRACGKSVVGRLLAERLGREFLDTDALLCERFGCSVAEFVGAQGWKTFRRREEELLRELCTRSGVVIATGGGAILHGAAWRALRENSLSIWLQADAQTVLARMDADSVSVRQRPALTGVSPAEEVRVLLNERTPLYRNGSDYGIDTSQRSLGEIVEVICDSCGGAPPQAM